MKRVERKKQKRREAEERNEYWQSLSPAEQLGVLERREHGQCKQADKLFELAYGG